jgi:hypothetical protein
MTTMERLASINVTINFELPVECYSMDDIIVMDAVKRDTLYHELQNEYEDDVYNIRHMSDMRRMLFLALEAFFEDSYYYENINAFREYQSHMNEPNFDWDFYSDWHKDMYGFRPR